MRLLCFFICTFSQALAQFYVAAPNTIRLGAEETVAVAHDAGNSQRVNLFLQDYPGKKRRFSELSFDVGPGKSEIVRIRVTQKDIPEAIFRDPNVRNYVALVVRSGAFNKEAVIPVTAKSGYVFVQTDKPIYTPKQSVNIRVIPLTERTLPSEDEFKLQITNPQDVIVKEELFNRGQGANRKAFISHVFKFPPEPLLGEWTITALYGNQFQHNSSVKVQVEKYVLPTFSLKLETPDVILPDHREISGTITAKYVYKKNVEGYATFKFGVKNEADNIVYLGSTKSIELDDGVAEFRINTDEMKNHKAIGWFPQINGNTLIVEATVTDFASGNKEIIVNQNGRFSESPFLISFKRCLRDFKPGLVSVVEADINFVNGKPAPGVQVTITAVADGRNQLKLNTPEAVSDEEGKVTFIIHPEVQHSTVTVTLRTNAASYRGRQATATHVQQKFVSRNNGYLAIARRSGKTLKPLQIFAEDLFIEPPQISDVYYMVVCRGIIVLMNKLPKGNFKSQKVEFQVTYDMVPSFRLVVFAHHGNELIADSLEVDVLDQCAPNARVTLQPSFQNKEPGSNGKIVIRGFKNTLVGLLAVDEAVYALRNKDLLTKSKMFKTMASHDLGCGPGGGGNTNTVMGNAGVVLMTSVFTPPANLLAVPACEAKARRKRAILQELFEKYPGNERKCCKIALLAERASSFNCEEKVHTVVERYRGESSPENCSSAFLYCCQITVNEIIGGNITRERIADDILDELEFIDIAEEAKTEKDILVRSDFRETWIFDDKIIGPDNREEMDVSFPHSITTWVIQAVSVSNQYGLCVADPQSVVSFQNVFIQLNLPYSVVRNEQIEIQATVFNYGGRRLPVVVYMYGVKDICSGAHEGQKSERKRVYVESHSAVSVSFPIIPLKTGEFNIKVVALSNAGSDIIVKKLNVVPEGHTVVKDVVVKLDPTNQQRRPRRNIKTPFYSDSIDPGKKLQVTAITLSLPENFIPDTGSCEVSALGDEFGPTVETSLQDPEKLILLPHGCGEQNMMFLGPTMYTMRYLKVAGKMTRQQENRGYDFIRQGYTRELNYRRRDGSFSAWGEGRHASVWLTAFVMKIFCQASELVYIDPQVVCKGLEWLRNNQKPDGSFSDDHPVIHWDMTGGVRGRASITAYVLIALHECTCDAQKLDVVKARAVSFLESQMRQLVQPLEIAIAAYALQMLNSDKKDEVFRKLQAIERYDDGMNTLHWETGRGTQDIEVTSYGLLAYLKRNDMIKCNAIVNWLNTKRLASGSFPSTQDTVMALQALSEYAVGARSPGLNLVSNITSSNDRNLKRVFVFREDNALVQQHLKIDKIGGVLFVNTAGHGVGMLTVRLKYNIPTPPEKLCKFDVKLTVTEAKDNAQADGNNPEKNALVLNLQICVKHLGERRTGMAIVDAGIFSGFVPNKQDLGNLVNSQNHFIERYEITSRSVVLYLDKIPTQDYCFTFRVNRVFIVGNTQMSVVRVYDYYNPDESCTRFYSPNRNSPMLNKICNNGICQCAEGGCPPKNPFEKIIQIEDSLADDNDKNEAARDELRRMACNENDYVWKGTPTEIKRNGGFLKIKFRIETVLKEGTEKRTDLVGDVRELLVRENCATGVLSLGTSYLIMGKDGEAYLDDDKHLWYRYLLDRSTRIHKWTSVKLARNEFLQKALNFMEKRLPKQGCLE